MCMKEEPTNNIKYGRSLLRFTCYKCGDPNSVNGYGCYSDRKSCRLHLFEDGICRHCNVSKDFSHLGCFHVKKKSWFL